MDVLKTIAEKAVEIMGEKYLIYKIAEGELKMVIHYPEITITNTRSETHLIRDLYVGSTIEKVSDTKWMLKNHKGRRYTLTYDEIFSGYIHSHLPRVSGYSEGFIRWQDFCQSTWFSDLQTRAVEGEMNPTDWTFLYLSKLSNYVGWESISGRPYHYIKEIGKRNQVNPNTMRRSNQFNIWFKQDLTKADGMSRHFRFYIEHGKISLHWTRDLTDYIIREFGSECACIDINGVSYQSNVENDIRETEEKARHFIENAQRLPFGNRVLEPRVINEQDQSNLTQDTHPYAKAKIKNYVENSIQKEGIQTQMEVTPSKWDTICSDIRDGKKPARIFLR